MRVLLLLLLLASSLAAQEVRSDDVVVRKLPGLPEGATHGYHEIVFLATNRSETRAHQVRIDVPDAGSGGTQLLGRLTRTVELAPSASVRLALHQPPLPLAGNGVRVYVDGRLLPDRITLFSGHPNPRTYYASAPSPSGIVSETALRVLVSQRIEVETLPESQDPGRYLVAVAALDAWSGDWLAYSGYDGVVLTARELAEAGAAVRDALWRYAEAGGAVLALGPPAEAPGGELAAAVEEQGLAVVYTGFGVVMAATETPGAWHDRVQHAWERSSEAWALAGDPASVHRLLPVLDDVRVPVRGIFLMVLAFAVLIGPVNLFVLARLRRRIWLLWTVPVAALAACAAIFLYTLLDEGLQRVYRGASLTVLDERSHRAVTLAWTGYYSTLTPAGGLRFERDLEVTPVATWSHGGAGSVLKTLDLTAGQHLAADWVRARLPAYFMVRRNALRRERLPVRRVDGGLAVTNGLGVEILELHLADAEGRVHHSSGVAAGATAPLSTLSVPAVGRRPEAVRDLYRAELPSRLERLRDEPRAHLQPATYVAVLAGDPFLDPGMEGLRKLRREALVYGFLAEVP